MIHNSMYRHITMYDIICQDDSFLRLAEASERDRRKIPDNMYAEIV